MKGSWMVGLLLLTLSAAGGAAAGAGGPRLQLPLICDMGKVCSVQNLPDHDPGPGFRDYNCGSLGYDGHKGTDIRVPNLRVMKQGVEVVAAADGRVRATRDGMPDVGLRAPGQREAIRGREAGNAVVVVHGDGWETQYSHMLRGSIRVKPGQMVKAGQVLGRIGLSGKTEFPHLHFSVRHHGRTIDPFTGTALEAACGDTTGTLWSRRALAALPYRPTGLLQAGFASERPVSERLEAGDYAATRIAPDAPAIVFWVELFGVRKGDIERFQLLAPDGRVIARQERELQRNRARQYSYTGKRRRQRNWAPGSYEGRYQLLRKGPEGTRPVVDIVRELRVQAP
ncbi:MAG TPA: M23 family metallopeptidase [Sedimenticola thiotaurini]|uniref:M23 family metallopeptidase n=1 Tax=Sedimenticola thiotaurini TaxID=1543721 RepID=A0A831W9X0_9GAMM|nr:M23 family metallopeptidase [Sedimenticola thiotaurini]